MSSAKNKFLIPCLHSFQHIDWRTFNMTDRRFSFSVADPSFLTAALLGWIDNLLFPVSELHNHMRHPSACVQRWKFALCFGMDSLANARISIPQRSSHAHLTVGRSALGFVRSMGVRPWNYWCQSGNLTKQTIQRIYYHSTNFLKKNKFVRCQDCHSPKKLQLNSNSKSDEGKDSS